MKRKIQILALAAFALISTSSCQKEDSGEPSPLQKQATELEKYVVNNHFIPVDFYADKPIDYIETDESVLQETDLKKYIFDYLKDDVITFNPGGELTVMQGTSKIPDNNSPTFTRTWSTETSKAKNVVYLNYLDYYYEARRYTLVEWTSDHILAYVDWNGKNGETAKIYTRFEKQ